MIVIILISDISGGDDSSEKRPTDKISFESADIYAAGTEERLCAMLSEIEGVGKAKVMQSENSYVIIDNGSQKEALLKKINNPAVSGVLVVCEGGDDPKVCEKVYIAVSTALNIPTNKIYVAEMK